MTQPADTPPVDKMLTLSQMISSLEVAAQQVSRTFAAHREISQVVQNLNTAPELQRIPRLSFPCFVGQDTYIDTTVVPYGADANELAVVWQHLGAWNTRELLMQVRQTATLAVDVSKLLESLVAQPAAATPAAQTIPGQPG